MPSLGSVLDPVVTQTARATTDQTYAVQLTCTIMYRNELVAIIYSRPMPRQNAKLHISGLRKVQGVPPECLGQTAKVGSALPLYSTRSIGLERGGEETACHCAKRVSSPHKQNKWVCDAMYRSGPCPPPPP